MLSPRPCIITHYSSGRITARYDESLKISQAYDHSLSATENHLSAAVHLVAKHLNFPPLPSAYGYIESGMAVLF